MILRRLAHSVRKQDWLAVAIEFVIVVAGIFVGLQVNKWNEQRQLREREQNYLERLAEDVARMEAEFTEIDGRPSLAHFDLDAACKNRELRNAAWEIYDLMWDWEQGTLRAAGQLKEFGGRLDGHISRGLAGVTD